MISLSIQEKAYKEALHQVFINSKFGLGGHLIILIVVAYLLMDKLSSAVILLGVTAHLVTLIGRTLLVIKYKKNQNTILDIKTLSRWQNLYLIGSFLTGFLWGLLPFFIGDLAPEYHFLIFAIIVGLGGAGLLTLGLVPGPAEPRPHSPPPGSCTSGRRQHSRARSGFIAGRHQVSR